MQRFCCTAKILCAQVATETGSTRHGNHVNGLSLLAFGLAGGGGAIMLKQLWRKSHLQAAKVKGCNAR